MRDEVFEIFLKLYFDPDTDVPLTEEDIAEDPNGKLFYDFEKKIFYGYKTNEQIKTVSYQTTFAQRCLRHALEIWETFDKGIKNA